MLERCQQNMDKRWQGELAHVKAQSAQKLCPHDRPIGWYMASCAAGLAIALAPPSSLRSRLPKNQ